MRIGLCTEIGTFAFGQIEADPFDRVKLPNQSWDSIGSQDRNHPPNRRQTPLCGSVA